MGVRLARAVAAGSGSSADGGSHRSGRRCAFVNNMPDGAFEATERQFLDLLDAGSGCETIEVSRHTMAGVPRGNGRRPASPRSTCPSKPSSRIRPTC